MVDTKLTALAELSVVDLSDDVYVVDNTGPTSNKLGTDRLMGILGLIPGGRLTTESGVAVSTADRLAQSTLYYTPYLHNRIRIFDGTRWVYYSFAELSLALTGLTSGKNYDVFIYDNAGTLTLELSAAWTTDTARADALTTQDGVRVKSGATTRLWLGTIRTTATTTTEDSGLVLDATTSPKRFVWNAYNRVNRPLRKGDTTDSWTYTSTTLRQARAATSNQVEVVNGLLGSEALDLNLIAYTAGTIAGISTVNAIGEDGTTAISGQIGRYRSILVINTAMIGGSFVRHSVPLGYHYYTWLEESDTSGTVTWYGDAAIPLRLQSGLTGMWAC